MQDELDSTTIRNEQNELYKSRGFKREVRPNHRVHRGAFCQFPFRWIYYYGRNKSTGKETGKTHLCGVGWGWLGMPRRTQGTYSCHFSAPHSPGNRICLPATIPRGPRKANFLLKNNTIKPFIKTSKFLNYRNYSCKIRILHTWLQI